MERPCKDGQLNLAIQAMKNDPNLSARSAAKIYSVSLTTLLRRRRGTTSRRDSPPNSRKLTQSEEETIIKRILNMDSRSYLPRLGDVEAMANILLAA
ncbi:hypothetical protein V502_01434 [Pseudogymnoascus sp. VKM F-4520 (FW-2644)]|nr:hypothetical protein V502_01434 [Pseudogymnoascus sp. VKM F-4520 (FW-2644)]